MVLKWLRQSSCLRVCDVPFELGMIKKTRQKEREREMSTAKREYPQSNLLRPSSSLWPAAWKTAADADPDLPMDSQLSFWARSTRASSWGESNLRRSVCARIVCLVCTKEEGAQNQNKREEVLEIGMITDEGSALHIGHTIGTRSAST